LGQGLSKESQGLARSGELSSRGFLAHLPWFPAMLWTMPKSNSGKTVMLIRARARAAYQGFWGSS
jgi:hypothetical protein